jgi:hypothetical protein
VAFNLFEIASFLGRPVCLYQFQWGGQLWRYTSADRDIIYPEGGGTVWTAIPISDNGFSQGAQPDSFVVTLPRALEFVQLFTGTPPSTSIILTAYRFHKDDLDNEASVYWVGTIGSVKGIDAVKAEVTGLSISQTIRRTGNRVGWEVNCPHALFDPGCALDRAPWEHVTTITGIAGVNVTVADLLPALTGANYAGGFFEWDATGYVSLDRRPIDTFVGGTTFALLGRADRLTVGQTISIYPGCDQSAVMCNTVFDNLPNHGGFLFMSKKSPFDGNPIY